MKKTRMLAYGLTLIVLAACAPVHYDAAYYDYYDPVSVGASYNHSTYHPATTYGSIEVTLFADHTYLDLNFQPLHLVIHDGDYVQVPLRNKKGKLKYVYAHYHMGDLHFDSSRRCTNISGTSRFKYDKRWDRGHRYEHISAGNDYDLRGYKLNVRKQVAKPNLNTKHKSRHVANTPQNHTSHNVKLKHTAKPAQLSKFKPRKSTTNVFNVTNTNKKIVIKKQVDRNTRVNKKVTQKTVLNNKRVKRADLPRAPNDHIRKRAVDDRSKVNESKVVLRVSQKQNLSPQKAKVIPGSQRQSADKRIAVANVPALNKKAKAKIKTPLKGRSQEGSSLEHANAEEVRAKHGFKGKKHKGSHR